MIFKNKICQIVGDYFFSFYIFLGEQTTRLNKFYQMVRDARVVIDAHLQREYSEFQIPHLHTNSKQDQIVSTTF